MNLSEYVFTVGAAKPFTAFHMSDNHICLADGRDDERKITLAERRERSFSAKGGMGTVKTAETLMAKVKEENALLLHTGDLIDFVSYKNLDFAERYFDGVNAVMCAGNHEFSLYVGEAWEDEVYKAQSLDKVKKALPDGIIFGVKEVNGVRFITLDNSYYYILPELYEKTKAALAADLPCVLLVHTPLYSEDTYRKVMQNEPDDAPPYLCGCPDRLLRHLSEHRYKQQRADETTLAFLRLCNSAKSLKAVLTGHIHKPCFSYLDSGIPQIAASGAYEGTMNRYIFK